MELYTSQVYHTVKVYEAKIAAEMGFKLMVNVLVHIQPHNLNKFGLLELDGEFYSDFPLSFPTAHD